MSDKADPDDTPRMTPAEAVTLTRFGADADDLIALAAYALHRRAFIDFGADFATQHGREPKDGEIAAFLVGETSASRIALYRREAEILARREAPAGTSGKPQACLPHKARWPWFGMWIDAPLAPPGQPERINWRGLFSRLGTLLLAVIVTAIALRLLLSRARHR
jgi:hypothetical protein